MKQILSYVVWLIVFPLIGVSWNSNGHQIIAQIAYDNVKPSVKKQIDNWLNAMPASQSGEQGFDSAATWPDRIKEQDVDAFNQWHYIDIAYVKNHIKPSSIDSQNVVWAIDQSQKVLASNKASLYDKALFLRFYIHFVGDIHQPLHCITLYSRRFPHSDVGGNQYEIKSSVANNLHSLWDNAVGAFGDNALSQKQIIQYANDLQRQYPQKQFSKQIADQDPMHWAKQSYRIARNIAYKTPLNGRLSVKYIQTGQNVAKQQMVLAGYRLAFALNHLQTK